ncbi:hypothetical protein OEZ85_012527 [Tetradesmus obliquus]|uniref:Uncharacterized protein n=1 Tax=Tetradesmus obliquus TaxID=3088 RepID=A0ABY8TTM4_TETOB|nr:hypothetical protein OEZ85_012527 [Tetradesmus obliquus]
MGAQRHLTVVLLAGGPGGSTAKDILAATAEPPHVESRLAHRKQLLRGAKGSGYVAPGLTDVCRMPVLKSWLTALKYCQRLQQGSEQPCIYVACNEPDLQDTQQLLDSIQDMKGLRVSVISNGCSDPAHTWAGEAADLATAAAAITAAGRSGPILAIGCSLLLLPEHNVSRIIEHALLRNSDVCCFSRLSATDLQLDAGASPGAAAPGSSKSSGGHSTCGSSGTTYGRLLITADAPAPPLEGIEVMPASSCQPGDAIAEPMLLLNSADSLPAYCAAAAAASQQPSLVDIAVQLCGQPADSLLYRQYKTLDPCLHEERAAVANSGGKAGSGALAAAGSSSSGSSRGAGAATSCGRGVGAGSARGGQLMASQLAAAVLAKQVDSEALGEELFFERTGAVNTAGIQQPYYHLPKTFFSSTSLRAAEAAAGTTLRAARKQ